jgi:hypothetical protein
VLLVSLVLKYTHGQDGDIFLLICISLITYYLLPHAAKAAYDPLSVPNNKVGIHLISPNASEAQSAKDLVNANGDWGYVTVIIEQKDKDHDKWQTFFNELRRDHLIPLSSGCYNSPR